jgi:hypothetical protein
MTKAKNLPAELEAEADNIIEAAQGDSGFEKLLKFKKGKYSIGDDDVPLGHKYLAHTSQWTLCWIKFIDGRVADRRMGKVADGYRLPKREDLDDNDPATWEVGLDGKPQDPWCFQYLLPLEDLKTGEVAIFTTSSIGGRRGVADLCKAYGNRAKKGLRGLPIVKLSFVDMPTKAWGPVPRPDFIIDGWDDDEAASGAGDGGGGGGDDDIKVITTAAVDLNDEIPFN